MKKIDYQFFNRDVLQVANDLVGKLICRKIDSNKEIIVRITETEAYKGEEDKACHAHKGRTPRTEVMYQSAGTIYVYLVYGMHWMFNIVTAEKDNPQAVLIRAVNDYDGPGKLTKALKIDKSFNYQKIYKSKHLCLYDDSYRPDIIKDKRIGIDYAGKEWADKLWRYIDNAKK